MGSYPDIKVPRRARQNLGELRAASLVMGRRRWTSGADGGVSGLDQGEKVAPESMFIREIDGPELRRRRTRRMKMVNVTVAVHGYR